MTPEVYFGLLDKLRLAISKKHTNFREPIPPETRLALTMRYLALGEGFRTLSQLFRVGLSTSRIIVQETCKAIINVLGSAYLQTPQTKEGWMSIVREYENRWQFPHCIGSIDGKHIRIIAPRKSGSYFFNYKDFFSIVLLAVVSADYRFIYVDIGSEGKSSDGGIWAKCSLYEHLYDPMNPLNIPCNDTLPGCCTKVPYFLVGDDAFRLDRHLLKPFKGHGLSRKEKIYNYRLSRCRRTVENAFGILSSRFRLFRRSIEIHPQGAEYVTMAACILHNYLVETNAQHYMPVDSLDIELDDGEVIPGTWRQEVELPAMGRSSQKNASEYAKSIRNHLKDYFVTKQGEIPWQYKKAYL